MKQHIDLIKEEILPSNPELHVMLVTEDGMVFREDELTAAQMHATAIKKPIVYKAEADNLEGYQVAWGVEVNGDGEAEAPKAVEAKPLEKLKKAELIAVAEEMGVKLDPEWTVKEILAAVKKFQEAAAAAGAGAEGADAVGEGAGEGDKGGNTGASDPS